MSLEQIKSTSATSGTPEGGNLLTSPLQKLKRKDARVKFTSLQGTPLFSYAWKSPECLLVVCTSGLVFSQPPRQSHRSTPLPPHLYLYHPIPSPSRLSSSSPPSFC